MLLPGLIDHHIHPFLGAVLMATEHMAPEPWRQADGSIKPAARTPEDYRRLLLQAVAAKPDKNELFVSFGCQASLHGRYTRQVLNGLFPDRPVLLIQRSFHEHVLNDVALKQLGITEAMCTGHPQIEWATGRFVETGLEVVLTKLMPLCLAPNWYHLGLRRMTQLMQQGGITTAADMLFGALDPAFELAALDLVLEKGGAPMRMVNVFDTRAFANHAQGRKASGAPDEPVDFTAAIAPMQAMMKRTSPKVRLSKAIKLFSDGAMFSQAMRMNAPGYIDGHEGEWSMTPPVMADGVRTFWNAGWQIHMHVNGDAALGAHASVNPYFLHALGDDYARVGLGPERASQITRCGSLARAGIKVSFHSDFMMAPPEPLLRAWCAATRKTLSGKVMSPDERLTLTQAQRGVTIDAAWALRMEHEVGSIVAGKLADFCVLEDDPFELGADGLKDVRVAGTVFEGPPHRLPKPAPSSIASLALVHADTLAQRKGTARAIPLPTGGRRLLRCGGPVRHRPPVGRLAQRFAPRPGRQLSPSAVRPGASLAMSWRDRLPARALPGQRPAPRSIADRVRYRRPPCPSPRGRPVPASSAAR